MSFRIPKLENLAAKPLYKTQFEMRSRRGSNISLFFE